MKKTLLLNSLLLLYSIFCLSQNQAVRDPYSGLEMALNPQGDYLTISSLKTGSPADLAPLRVGDRIYEIDNKSVKETGDLSSYFQDNSRNMLQVNIKKVNGESRLINIPRLSVDLYSKKQITEAELFNFLRPCQFMNYSKDISTEYEKWEHMESIVESGENPDAYFIKTLPTFKICTYFLKLNPDRQMQITTLADNSKNLGDYTSFDFEYTSQEDPLMEKTLLNDLEKQLLELGLKRDTQNPEILIIASFFSGQKEQFIPPQQIVSTRIQTYFNWYWGYIPVPLTETQTKEGRTLYTYLTNINIKFLDANEIASSKVPPVIWSSSYSEVSSSKTFLSDASKEVFSYLLLQFPKVQMENCENLVTNTYTYTGLIYHRDDPALIADVVPGSPAYEAGLRRGDEILKINDRKIQEEISDDYSRVYWQKRGEYKSALIYIFINSDFRDGNPDLFYSLKGTNEEYKNSGEHPLIFEMKRSGKKMTFSVIPEFKELVFFNDTGFTIE